MSGAEDEAQREEAEARERLREAQADAKETLEEAEELGPNGASDDDA